MVRFTVSRTCQDGTPLSLRNSRRKDRWNHRLHTSLPLDVTKGVHLKRPHVLTLRYR